MTFFLKDWLNNWGCWKGAHRATCWLLSNLLPLFVSYYCAITLSRLLTLTIQAFLPHLMLPLFTFQEINMLKMGTSADSGVYRDGMVVGKKSVFATMILLLLSIFVVYWIGIVVVSFLFISCIDYWEEKREATVAFCGMTNVMETHWFIVVVVFFLSPLRSLSLRKI